MPSHLTEEQHKILRAVALSYRRVMRAPSEAAETRADSARQAQQRLTGLSAAATAEYRRLVYRHAPCRATLQWRRIIWTSMLAAAV
jgi:hypothetical protein